MAITRDEVLETALLARLELAPEEIPALQADLAAILGYVATLAALDTAGVEPTTHAVPLDCPLRDDVTAPHLAHDEALRAAPAADEGCFVVPAIIGGDAPEGER
ncbi:MAG: Asp-tRNA(Asn)/Glu-tRNA(Gln) amidotransferase subunit GatC [Deltaproteobacteria bacterium]|nr:Asp-tRNA(Asn)/Glu-tRNA(Gln) amidotransferase subunit GatC [Deltaproteobacteria bacterium]